jgi:hypothetical protein
MGKKWGYIMVYNGEYDADEQDFADSLRAGYQIASEMANPVFVNVTTDYAYEYVVIHDGSMPEDTDWLELIDQANDEEDEADED